jgi:hypothetical protein
MSRRRIGILAHDQDLHRGEGLPEGPQDVRRRRQHLVPGRHFVREEGKHLPEFRFHARQGGGPVGRHELLQRELRKLGETGSARWFLLKFEQGI